ncbi:MAG: transcriptional regulator [Desulfurococcaceae archaeon]
MSRDQLMGWLLLVSSAAVIIVYTYLMFSGFWEILTKITLTLGVIAVFSILGWIGYTLVTTPPPKPIEEIEKEIEEELKKLEHEAKQQEGAKSS